MKELPTWTSRSGSDVVARHNHGAGVRLVLTGLVTAIVLAGCGSSSSSAPVATSGGTNAPAAASTGVGVAASSSDAVVQPKVEHSKVKVARANQHYARAQITRIPRNAKGGAVQRPKPGTGGDTTNDDNPTARASRADTGGRPSIRGVPNPCVLVSSARARAFTGKAITVTEAPLGPTCVYQEAGVTLPVTLVIERQRFASLKAHVRKASSFTVARRPAYCGIYGSPVTYVSLSGSRVLGVAAPCRVGAKFAAAALSKLGY